MYFQGCTLQTKRTTERSAKIKEATIELPASDESKHAIRLNILLIKKILFDVAGYFHDKYLNAKGGSDQLE